MLLLLLLLLLLLPLLSLVELLLLIVIGRANNHTTHSHRKVRSSVVDRVMRGASRGQLCILSEDVMRSAVSARARKRQKRRPATSKQEKGRRKN